jgi:peptidoglycan hydrolase-like protein with peptidoglycan-binding domain
MATTQTGLPGGRALSEQPPRLAKRLTIICTPTRTAYVALIVGLLCMAVPSARADTVLRKGDVGLDVLLWQRMLNMSTPAAFPRAALIAEDGIFGPETERATKRFEWSHQLPSDGVVRAREPRSWLGASATCCGARKPTLARGSYGIDVGLAQFSLNEWLRQSRSQPLTIDLLSVLRRRPRSVSIKRRMDY